MKNHKSEEFRLGGFSSHPTLAERFSIPELIGLVKLWGG